jgi:hypothetical protein
MAVNKEELEVDSGAALCRPIELITENGFSIVRADELDGARISPAHTYVFVVRDPHGHELEIGVEIAVAAINEIVYRSRGHTSTESSYWVACAERHLADYLFEHDDYPPDATLRVALLTPRDLNLARRWKTT